MDDRLFRKASTDRQIDNKKYEALGLTDNPFTLRPGVVRGGSDIRTNGTIYCQELTVERQKEFDKLLIPSPGNKPRSLVFLMDNATRSGRGIGKSAFLNNQCNRIMRDFGGKASKETEVIFAVWVRPDTDTKKFGDLCKAIAESFIEYDVIDQAIWRIKVLSGLIPKKVMEEISNSDDWKETIGNNGWLNSRGVDVYFSLNGFVRNKLVQSGIPEKLAAELADKSGLGNTHQIVSGITDFGWRREGGNFIFDLMVKLFLAAGFTKGLLLVDELEKVVYNQNIEEKRNFADSLRYYLFDANVENAKKNFYGTLLTIHPMIQELLIPHWKATGLDRFAPITQPSAKEYTIYFDALSEKMARPLVTVYLDAFRLSETMKGRIDPFTDDAIVEAILNSRGVPGEMIRLLYYVIEAAADTGQKKIEKKLVGEIATSVRKENSEEFGEIDIPPSTKTILKESN